MNSEQFVSYAQNHEDVVLARALRPDESTGFWIDVGAGDPVNMSVTAAFAERGWRGINIEPLPPEYARISEARPNDVNLEVALGATPGRAQLFEGPPENRGSSTLVPQIAERYRAEGQTFGPIEVQITTLAEVVAEHAVCAVDFLKVDVEGYELEVLQGADWSGFHPRIIVIEATEPNSTKAAHGTWEPILLEHGYRFAMFDGLNRFYASADEPHLHDALSIPANIQDNFVPYTWSALTAAARDAERKVRQHHDRTLIALEESAALRADLDAAQRMTAHVLEGAENAATDGLAAYDALQAQHAALLNTRLYRYSAVLRRVYGRMRRGRRASPGS